MMMMIMLWSKNNNKRITKSDSLRLCDSSRPSSSYWRNCSNERGIFYYKKKKNDDERYLVAEPKSVSWQQTLRGFVLITNTFGDFAYVSKARKLTMKIDERNVAAQVTLKSAWMRGGVIVCRNASDCAISSAIRILNGLYWILLFISQNVFFLSVLLFLPSQFCRWSKPSILKYFDYW